jgi:hypothetical protein
MQRIMLLFMVTLLGTVGAYATDVGYDVNINLSNRPAVVVPQPAPMPNTTIVIDEPPEFIYPSPLGFYVAIGVPYDMFFISGSYYLYSGNIWYRSVNYGGPWIIVHHDRLPYGLRKHRYERIIEVRDHEYRAYRQEREGYHGKHFRPERRVERHERREDRRDDHDKGHGKGHGKHD